MDLNNLAVPIQNPTFNWRAAMSEKTNHPDFEFSQQTFFWRHFGYLCLEVSGGKDSFI